jgi:HSP20 family protein
MLNTLFANDVRQTLDTFRAAVDEMFESFAPQAQYSAQNGAQANGSELAARAFTPIIESGWNENYLNLRVVVPGVNQNDIRLSVQNNQLLIEGERKAPEGWAKSAYTQLAYGRFQAVLTLPTGLDLDHVNCHLHDGILDVQLPIAESSKPKQIPIQTGSGQKTIAA